MRLKATTSLADQRAHVQEVLRSAVLDLQKARIESASLDARLLLQHVLGFSREELLMHMEYAMDEAQQSAYRTLIERRMARAPVAHLLGRREFWGRKFIVTEDTLDPRPDSETLITAVLAHAAHRSRPYRILDLGTGTGCLLLTLLAELPQAVGIGVDISDAALAVAQENSLKHGLATRSRFARSDWAGQVEGMFDIVISNPPYIPTKTIDTLAPEVAQYEPRLALDGGEDGMDCYRAIMAALPAILAEEGLAAFEIGINQQQPLEDIIRSHRLCVDGVRQDLSGTSRCVLVTKTK